MRSLGITSGLSTTFQPRPAFCTITSGTMMLLSACVKGRPGLGSRPTISACASRSSSSSAPVAAISFFMSRRASSSRCRLQTTTATACAGLRGSVRSCSTRHSARSRAPTPVGSRLCSQHSAQRSRSSTSSRPAVVVGEPLGDLLQRVGQVAVLVERVDQRGQRGGVLGCEAHARELRAQVVLQRFGGGAALAALEVVAVFAGAGGLAQLGQLGDAVEVLALGAVFPVVALGGAELGAVDAGRLVGVGGAGLDARLGLLALGAALAGGGALVRRLGRGRFLVDLQERVLLEHLVDLLLQLQRGELEQADRLLELRCQCEVLRQAQLQRRLHRHRVRHILKCSPR